MEDNLNDALECLEEDTQKNKFLTFCLGDEHYGVDIMYVTEIVGIQPITEMPDLPMSMRGIINLRGKIIPVMDARVKFKKEVMAYNDRTCIIVINVLSLMIGIIVDAVSEVMTIDDGQIVPPPIIATTGANYIKGIGKSNDQVTLILDCKKLLNEEELNQLNNEEDA